ncbi:diaminobutyrate acetyltransferase [Virgibacillus doumboii]|uniref:diaminobutyrate acetyltransferase n=1 Tax=Virgibacillus doumboii TaxID=2697503 RepID=UPI0013E0A0CB|nr:diaminobutyrate acetyltransferase [Virgibacillus doumboii]
MLTRNVTADKTDSLEKFREPALDDGADVWKLIKETGVLDLNSSYSYLMWCTIFSDTSVVIEADDEIVGFISGFIKPASPDKLFIWQVAVADDQRGKGLASKMLHHILERDICENVQYVEATVSPSNIPSRKLFSGLARSLDTKIEVFDCFTAKDFPEQGHEDELTHQIGPF